MIHLKAKCFIPISLFFFLLKSAEALDLWNCYNKAKDYDPKYQSIYHEYQAGLTLPKQALAPLLPQLNLSYSNLKYDFEEAPFYYRDYRAKTTSISLTQAIVDMPKIVEYQQSKIRRSMFESKLNYAKQDLIKRVIDAYFEVLYCEEALRVVEEEKKAIFEQLKMIRRLFEAGEATLADIHDAESRYSSIQLKAIEAEKNLYVAKNNLKRIIGEEPIELAKLKEEIHFQEIEPSNVEEWIRLAKENNNVIKYYALAKDVAEKDIRKQTYEYFPKVHLIATFAETNTNNYLRTETLSYYAFGFQVRFNLFSGGYITAKRSELVERFKQSEKEYESMVSDVVQQVTESFFGVKTALVQIYAAKTSLKSAEVALESTKKGFKAGIRTVVDVLNAESTVYKAKMDLVKAKYDYIKYLIGLKYFSGILSEEDVITINNWLSRR